VATRCTDKSDIVCLNFHFIPVCALINNSYNEINKFSDIKFIFYAPFVITSTCFNLALLSSCSYLMSVMHM
jgi:hypothetical protein